MIHLGSTILVEVLGMLGRDPCSWSDCLPSLDLSLHTSLLPLGPRVSSVNERGFALPSTSGTSISVWCVSNSTTRVIVGRMVPTDCVHNRATSITLITSSSKYSSPSNVWSTMSFSFFFSCKCHVCPPNTVRLLVQSWKNLEQFKSWIMRRNWAQEYPKKP